MGVKVRERDGEWWIFVDHQGRRKAKKIGGGKRAKALADAAATKIQARLLDGDLGIFDAERPAPAAPTFAEVYREWSDRYPALHAVAPTTMENYRSFAVQHLLPSFGARPITEVSVSTVEDFIEAKRAPGGSVRRTGQALADSSLKVGLPTLRLVLQRATRRGLIPANPMNDVEWRPAGRVEQVDPFTGRELRAILTAAERLESDFATLLRLWAQSGCRAGEVAGLQSQDVDLDAGTVKVRRTWSRQRLGPTKTRQERGGTDVARSVLHGLRLLTVRSLELEAFIFQRGGQPVSSMEVHRAWRRGSTGGSGAPPGARAAAAHLRLDEAVAQRSPALRPGPGRLALSDGAAQDLRPMDAATIRNRRLQLSLSQPPPERGLRARKTTDERFIVG